MKIYIASHSQEEARKVCELCVRAGHTVTSQWLTEDFSKTASYTDTDRLRVAELDRDDILAADTLLLLAGPRKCPGGKFVETGIALGAGKRVVVVGARENLLLYLCEQVTYVEDFLAKYHGN